MLELPPAANAVADDDDDEHVMSMQVKSGCFDVSTDVVMTERY